MIFKEYSLISPPPPSPPQYYFPLLFRYAAELSGEMGVQKVAEHPLFCKSKPSNLQFLTICDFISSSIKHITPKHCVYIGLIGTQKSQGGCKVDVLVPKLSILE